MFNTITDYSANNLGYIFIYDPAKKERIVRPRVLSRVVIIACKWEHKSNAKFDKFLSAGARSWFKVDRT